MDSQEFGRLYRNQFDCVYRYSLALTGNPASAEEITQEAFARLLRNGFEAGAIGRPEAWLMRVARNLAIETFRERAKDPSGSVSASSRSPEQLLLGNEILRRILVPRLSLHGFLILNSKEVLSRASVSSSVEDLKGTKQPFFILGSRNGLLVLSYRPFPGASASGYFEDKKLQFEWNGDLYEWISTDDPFMPPGKWAVYVWQADNFPYTYASTGGFEADPNSSEFASKLSWFQQSRKKTEVGK